MLHGGLKLLPLLIFANAFRCPPDDGHYPKQGDCKAFYKCYKGKPALLRCPANLYFNPDAQVCDWLANVNCDLVALEIPDKSRRRGYEDVDSDDPTRRRKPGIRRRKLRRKPVNAARSQIYESETRKSPLFLRRTPPSVGSSAEKVKKQAASTPIARVLDVQTSKASNYKLVKSDADLNDVNKSDEPTEIPEKVVKESEIVEPSLSIRDIVTESSRPEQNKSQMKSADLTEISTEVSLDSDDLVDQLLDTYQVKPSPKVSRIVPQKPTSKFKPENPSGVNQISKKSNLKNPAPRLTEQRSSHERKKSKINSTTKPPGSKKMLFFGKPNRAEYQANRFNRPAHVIPSTSRAVFHGAKQISAAPRFSSARVTTKRPSSPSHRPTTVPRPGSPRVRPAPPRARLTHSDNGYTPFYDNGKNLCNKKSKEPITEEILSLRKISCMASNSVVKKVKPSSTANPPNVKILESIFSEDQFDEVFPRAHRAYTYENFLKAFAKFPEVCGEELLCRYTLATMFAHFKQETDDLFYLEEINKSKYCGAWSDWLKEAYPCVPGRKYYGRGSKQLSWNYNYGAFSNAMFGDPMVLLENPDWVADTWLNFASALWFYATPQPPKPSMLAVVHQTWEPSDADLQAGRTYGFGVTTMIVNGGIECGEKATNLQGSQTRQSAYIHYAQYFDVDIRGEKLDCTEMEPFDATSSTTNPSIYWAPEHGCTLATWQTAYSALVEGDYQRCLDDTDVEYYEYYDDLY